jgi:hypothetical protein
MQDFDNCWLRLGTSTIFLGLHRNGSAAWCEANYGGQVLSDHGWRFEQSLDYVRGDHHASPHIQKN